MESIQTLIIWIASYFWLKMDPFGTVYGCPAFEKKISRGDSFNDPKIISLILNSRSQV